MRKSLFALAALALCAGEAAAQYGPPPGGYRPAPPPYGAPLPPPGYGIPPPRPPIVVGPGPGYGPPPGWRHRRSYGWCREKAERLYAFEQRARGDGFITPRERRITEMLRADLRNSCGGGRWAPGRGWYY